MEGADGDKTVQGPSAREEERILVSVRVRPLNEKEASRNEVVDWECVSDTTIVYKNHLSPDRSMYPTSYTFDRVFKCDCSTRQVYEEGAKTVVLSAVSGINSSVFAYGQTSSGKTFTMFGITEYTMEDIFDYIQKHKEREFQLKFSAMEIYNESVRDLLTADNSPLRLLDDPERGTVVEKLTEETLRDWNHFKELLDVCEAQRQIGETFLNEVSSRSHQILRLTIESSTRDYLGKSNTSSLASTLNFVDLAGSERASQALSAGSRLKEGSHINRSLLTLGTVIRKLSKGRTGHIPYRDSKLTRILQPSLGGNARAAIICTMSPARSYVEQSRNTLLFASCAKEVTTTVRVNLVMSDKALVKHLQKELARLENEMRSSSPLVRIDAKDLLREKDSEIEELQKLVRELSLRLDLTLSQVHDLKQEVEDRSPTRWEGEYSCYPRLHVRQASESSSSGTTTVADHHSDAGFPTSETAQSPDRHSRLSYDENYSNSDIDENLPPSSPFERMFVETPSDASSPMFIQPCSKVVGLDCHQVMKGLGEQATNLSDVHPYIVSEGIGDQSPNSYEIDPYQVSEVGGQTPETFEIRKQQVTDGQGTQSPYFVDVDPYQVSDEIESQTPDYFETDQYRVSRGIPEENRKYDNVGPLQTDDHLNDYCKEVQCIESEMTDNVRKSSLPLKEEEEESLSSMGHENKRRIDYGPKQETELCNSFQDPPEPSGRQQLHVVPEVEDLHCLESRSVQSNDTSKISSSLVEKIQCEVKNEHGDEGDKSVVSLENMQWNLSALKYDAENEVSQISSREVEIDEIPATDIKVLNHRDNTEEFTRVKDTKEGTDLQWIEQHPDHQLEDTAPKANKSVKKMKDVGLNPPDDLDTSSPWLSDFNRLQGEIIDLWHICNVSLVHRTYFFLVFIRGDTEDTIYMEVERRRLSFIKDASCWGNSVVLDGTKLTTGSSKRSVHSEREMLGRLMKRRFSSQERKDLYVKWGIRLDAKKRSSKLAHRLWTDTTNMGHVTESANIIAKLVRFNKPQVPKEVFGLNLISNLGRRKSFGCKSNPSVLI